MGGCGIWVADLRKKMGGVMFNVVFTLWCDVFEKNISMT